MSQPWRNVGRSVRTLALLIAVITFAGCIVPRREAFGSHRLKERLPKEAWEITKGQLEHLVGSHDVRGVPILDPSVDWGEPKNWPEHFQFRGERFLAKYGIDSISDVLFPIQPSRDSLPKYRDYRIQFFPDDVDYGTTQFIQILEGAWRSFGSLRRLMLRFRTGDQIECTFHPDGRLYSLNIIEWHGEENPSELNRWMRALYYDGTGRFRGFMDNGGRNINAQPVYEWDGKAVDFETFEKLSVSIKLD